jgi:hypothetical protein
MQDQVAAYHFNLNDACRFLQSGLPPSEAACEDWIYAVCDNVAAKLEIFSRQCVGYNLARCADRVACYP